MTSKVIKIQVIESVFHSVPLHDQLASWTHLNILFAACLMKSGTERAAVEVIVSAPEEVSSEASRSKKDDVKVCDRCGSPMKLKRA